MSSLGPQSARSFSARPPLAGVILAGGLSRRMFLGDAASGVRDKGLLALGGQSMLARVIERLQPQVSAMVLNANGDPARFAAYGLPVVADPIDGFVGPLAGVLAGLRWAKTNVPGVTHVMSVSADAPFLPDDLAAQLYGRALELTASIPLAESGGELHPVIGCWPIALADDLERALQDGVRKVLRWTDRHGTVPVHFAMLKIGREIVDPFFNANTPEELALARRLIESAHP